VYNKWKFFLLFIEKKDRLIESSEDEKKLLVIEMGKVKGLYRDLNDQLESMQRVIEDKQVGLAFSPIEKCSIFTQNNKRNPGQLNFVSVNHFTSDMCTLMKTLERFEILGKPKASMQQYTGIELAFALSQPK
jgi:hypothetical protein